MSGYGCFARYYDRLTEDVDYRGRARYFDGLIKAHCPEAALLLDLACGTGRLTRALGEAGYDMIGVDASQDMLASAMGTGGGDCLFLCQKAEELDLYGTIDACVCALDSLNHLPGEAAVRKAMKRVSLFLNPGGVFVFDVNTVYKHRTALADTDYIYEYDDLLCAWRNRRDPETDRVDIALDFFVRDNKGLYRRESESFSEYCYPSEAILEMIRSAGLLPVAEYEGDSLSPAGPETQRAVYVAVKPK